MIRIIWIFRHIQHYISFIYIFSLICEEIKITDKFYQIKLHRVHLATDWSRPWIYNSVWWYKSNNILSDVQPTFMHRWIDKYLHKLKRGRTFHLALTTNSQHLFSKWSGYKWINFTSIVVLHMPIIIRFSVDIWK